MMKDQNEEAERWDLEPKPASQWWSSTFVDEIKEDMMIKTRQGSHKFSSKKSVEMHGSTRGKTCGGR